MNREPATYVLLRACSRSERLNAGIVLFASGGPFVGVTPERRRLAALHPDFAAVNLDGWAESVETAIRNASVQLPQQSQQIALLPLLVQPFEVDGAVLQTAMEGDPREVLANLMEHQVLAPRRGLARIRIAPRKKHTRLHLEIRAWLRGAKAFGPRIEDISRSKVVANYPVDVAADLYTDFALKNGSLHVIETLDLRGVERLTAAMRGEAAIKGITLDEARDKAGAEGRIAVISASDYGVARPAVSMLSRYASDVYEVGTSADRQRFATFLAQALHLAEIPGLEQKLTGHPPKAINEKALA